MGDEVKKSEENLTCAVSVKQLNSVGHLRTPGSRSAKLRWITSREDAVQLGDRETDGGSWRNGVKTGQIGHSSCGWCWYIRIIRIYAV